MKCKYYIHLLFFVYSFIYISLLLFCLFSAVCGIQKFNLKFSTLIAFVMSFHASKMWLFYSKLEVNMVFPCAGSSTFPFHHLVFIVLVMIALWIMMVMKRTNRTNIQLIKMIMIMKIVVKGKKIRHHHKRNQKRNHHTIGERLSLQLMT